METIIKVTPDGNVSRTSDCRKWCSFVDSMAKSNTFCPNISRIIFNLKTSETRPVLDANGNPILDEKGRARRQTVSVAPVLSTTVYFEDGTKCTVVNSDKDPVMTEEKEVTYTSVDKSGKKHTIKTGHIAMVASEAAKEAGVVYAITKRLLGKVDRDPKSRTYRSIQGNGFGRKLRGLVADAFDTQYAAAYDEEMRKLAAKEHKDREAAAKARRANRKPTLEENIATLVKQNAELLAKLSK